MDAAVACSSAGGRQVPVSAAINTWLIVFMTPPSAENQELRGRAPARVKARSPLCAASVLTL
jgi:hypothetical protein